jgi:hypothetical protein
MTPGHNYFHDRYRDARKHFRAAASDLGARLRAYPIEATGPDGEELALDLAWLGPIDAPNLLFITSGIHGVEGHSGGAIQRALLDAIAKKELSLPSGTALALLHAVNPYGLAFTRRFNPNNVDLNRNFLPAGETYSGANAGYVQFNELLNPESAPVGLDFFLPKAGWLLIRHGMPAMKQAVAEGQYEYSTGLFFGGSERQPEADHLLACIAEHFGAVTRMIHIDCHTGLGKPATFQLLIDDPEGSEGHRRAVKIFGGDVHPWKSEGSVAYQVRGGLSPAVSQAMPKAVVDSLTLEFGTCAELAVITALRAENRLHHWGDLKHSKAKQIKTRLRETFAPASIEWRDSVVASGLRLVQTALDHLGSAAANGAS